MLFGRAVVGLKVGVLVGVGLGDKVGKKVEGVMVGRAGEGKGVEGVRVGVLVGGKVGGKVGTTVNVVVASTEHTMRAETKASRAETRLKKSRNHLLF